VLSALLVSLRKFTCCPFNLCSGCFLTVWAKQNETHSFHALGIRLPCLPAIIILQLITACQAQVWVKGFFTCQQLLRMVLQLITAYQAQVWQPTHWMQLASPPWRISTRPTSSTLPVQPALALCLSNAQSTSPVMDREGRHHCWT